MTLRCRTSALTERRLRGREPRDRHPERRAGHVIKTDLVAERDRGRITAMLAADAELDVFTHLAATLGGDAHQFADAVAIDRHERVVCQNAFCSVDAQKACGIVAADTESGLGQIV